MIKIIKDTLVWNLHEYTGLPIPNLDTEGIRVSYPFLTLKITSPMIDRDNSLELNFQAAESTNSEFAYDIVESRVINPHTVLSITSYSDDIDEAYKSIKKAYDWVLHVGYRDLKDINVVVVETTDIQDRTIDLEGIKIEYRYGFDVRIRYRDVLERRTETIDKGKIQKGEHI